MPGEPFSATLSPYDLGYVTCLPFSPGLGSRWSGIRVVTGVVQHGEGKEGSQKSMNQEGEGPEVSSQSWLS